jgi:hypothetical protein
MKRSILAACAVASLSFASAAQAQSQIKPADQADLECLAVTLVAGSQFPEGSAEHAGIAGGLMYFLGKLEGRTPGVDWLERLTGYLLTLDEAFMARAAPRCGAEMEAKGRALSEWGQRMTAMGQ